MKRDTGDNVLAAAIATPFVLAILLLAPLVAIPITIYEGFVFQKAWNWFVVPGLAVRPLALPVACGLFFLVRMVQPGTPVSDELKKTPAWALMIGRVMSVTMTLVTVWLLHTLLR